MTCGRGVAICLGAWLLWGCFSEPSSGGGATGPGQTSSTTAVGSSSGTGSDNTATTSSTSTGGTSEIDSTTSGSSSTSIGTTPATGFSTDTSGDSSSADSSPVDPPQECDMGFDGLEALALGAQNFVSFSAFVSYSSVTILVEQVSSGASQLYEGADDTQEGDGSITWVLPVSLGDEFVGGDAVVTFQGFEGRRAFTASCQVTLE